MPRLSILLSDENLDFLTNQLKRMKMVYHPFSVCEQRHVRRVPLKPPALTQEEHDHLIQSLDGLSCFEPVDIYDVNIQSYDGLLRSIHKCQVMDGMGLSNSPRQDEYSVMLLDVSTFWMAFRTLYSFTGLVPSLHDVFLFLGPWHTYVYSHVCVWPNFRSSFLAAAWFKCFPNQNLFFRPRLLVSSTFFTWLRVPTYPNQIKINARCT